MTRARNIAGFSTITTTPSPVHVGPIGVLTATRIDGEFGDRLDISARNLTGAGIAATHLQVSGITTGLNVSGIITAQNGINFNGTSTGLNVSGVGTIATLSVTGNATVGGVLTYEDVTRVDSIGIVTARSGLVVSSGVGTFNNTGAKSLNATRTDSGSVALLHRTGNTSGGGAEIRVSDGFSSTVPVYGFWYNNTTGIGNPAANATSFIQSGSEKVRILSDGKVGIGLTNPNSEFVLKGSAHTNLQVFSGDEAVKGFLQTVQGSDVRIGSNSNHPLHLFSNSAIHLTAATNGNIGIGTLVPGAKLHLRELNPEIYLNNSGAGNGTLRIGHFTNGVFIGSYDDDGGNSDHLRFGTHSGDERMRIDTSGNILTSGNTQLIGSLTSDGNDDKAIMINGGGAVSDSRGGYLLVHGNEHSSNPGITRLHAGNVGTAFIAFNTAGSERMRIASTGPHIFVGGTTSVNEITETSSSSGLVIGNTSMGNGGLAIINSTTGTGRIYFGDSVGGNAGRNQGQINYYHNGNYMLFATAGSERMRIASNGTITSTITSPDPFNTIQTNLQLTNGAGNSGAGSRINFACGSSQAHIQSQVTGGNSTNGTALVFATSDSASAGTARVRIETDGRLSFATEANAAGSPDAVIDIGSHSNKATIRFKGCDNKSGMMLHKRIHNGAAASSNAVTLLTVNQWQSPNSHIFGVVTVMGVSPTSAFGFQVRGYFFAERGSSNTNLTNTQVGTMAVIEGTGTGGNPQGTLSWSGQNLQYNTPAVAYVDMHVNVEYHAYDGATVTLNVDKATH